MSLMSDVMHDCISECMKDEGETFRHGILDIPWDGKMGAYDACVWVSSILEGWPGYRAAGAKRGFSSSLMEGGGKVYILFEAIDTHFRSLTGCDESRLSYRETVRWSD